MGHMGQELGFGSSCGFCNFFRLNESILSLFANDSLTYGGSSYLNNRSIDVFGGNRRQVEAAEAYLAATVEDKRDVFVSLAAEVARSYLELRASQHRLAIARENSRTQEQTVELVRNKFQIGLGGELEVAQAETLLAQTTAQIPALDSSAIQAMHQLALLLGQQPHTLKAELITPTPTPPVPPQLPAVLPSELLRQRPDIRSAERQLAAATATVGVATAELFPRFSLSALINPKFAALLYYFRKELSFLATGRLFFGS